MRVNVVPEPLHEGSSRMPRTCGVWNSVGECGKRGVALHRIEGSSRIMLRGPETADLC